LVDWSESKNLIKSIYPYLDELSISICYRSIHKDHFMVTRNGYKTGREINEIKESSNCDPKKFATGH
jgi:hypothetical protein